MLKGNKLSLNLAKTRSMPGASHNKHTTLMGSSISFNPRIGSKEVEIRKKTKYFGVQIDEKLSWKEHISEISPKISNEVGLLKHSKHYLPISAISSLYNRIVEPYFLYCCSVWGCCSATEIQHLQMFHNRAARIVTNSVYDAPIKSILEKLRWKTMQQ